MPKQQYGSTIGIMRFKNCIVCHISGYTEERGYNIILFYCYSQYAIGVVANRVQNIHS